MPGGVYNWNQGDVLDAADLNEFLGNQVIARFTNTAARTAAYGVSHAPALEAGLFAWTADDEKLYYYDGTSWEEVGSQVADGEITAVKIASDAVTTVKILDSAVTSAKIADGTIVNADVNASAAIAYSKLNLGTSIVNADVSTTAAIDLGKLADATIDEKSASYPLVLTDKNKFIKMSVGTANTVTVPTNASVAFPIGSQIHIIQYGIGKTQVIPVSGTVTLYATPGAYLRAQYSAATLLKCDTNIWMLIGDLSAS